MRKLYATFLVVCAGVPGFYCYDQAVHFSERSNVGHLIATLGALVLTVVLIWGAAVVATDGFSGHR